MSTNPTAPAAPAGDPLEQYQWAARISGHPIDVGHLVRSFRPEDALHIVECDRSGVLSHFLVSPHLEAQEPTDAAEAEARKLVGLANSALRLNGLKPVQFEGLSKRNPGKGRTQILSLSAALTIRVGFGAALVTNGPETAPAGPSTGAEFVQIALSRPELTEAACRAGQADNWVELYRLFELLRNIAAEPSDAKDTDAVDRLMGQSRRVRFTRTCQIERHEYMPYDQPLSLDEGRSFILALIREIYWKMARAAEISAER